MENETTPRRRTRLRIVLACTIVILLACSIVSLALRPMISERWRSRPQLHVKNTGTVALVLRLGKDRVAAQPSSNWSFRFSPGDTLTVFAGSTESSPSKTVPLQAAPYEHVQAETCIDNDGQIALRFTRSH